MAISLGVIRFNVLTNDLPQMTPTERNSARQTFVPYRFDPALRVGVQVRTTRRYAYRLHGDLLLSVEDRGIGISPDDLPQVGTPFFRTDRSRTRQTGGVGLGLSLSRKIVLAHGGSLEIDSTLDKGTRVRVRLPGADATGV